MFDPNSDDLKRAVALDREAVDLVFYLCRQIEEAELHVHGVASCVWRMRRSGVRWVLNKRDD